MTASRTIAIFRRVCSCRLLDEEVNPGSSKPLAVSQQMIAGCTYVQFCAQTRQR